MLNEFSKAYKIGTSIRFKWTIEGDSAVYKKIYTP